jgi:hypothetical protein
MCGWRKIKSLFGCLEKKTAPLEGAHERESPRVVASLFVSRENQSAVLETEGNVSLGGFCYAAGQAFEPGARLDIMVDLQELSRWLITRGEVLGCYEKDGRMWVRGRFLEIDFEEQRWLARWLDWRSLAAA